MSASPSESSQELPGSDREIVLTRVVAAPRELVWRAFTDPQQLVEWWGPRGFTTTTRAMAVEVGGGWRFVMHGPDGRDYENRITYIEVEAPVRLRYKHGGDVETEPVNFEVTVTFDAEAGDRTRITMRSVFSSPSAREFVVRNYNAVEGGKQTLARLAEHLGVVANGAGGSRPFVIERVVRAPRELVFAAWTRKDHLEHWFGPKGCSLTVRALELRPGGVCHYGMRFPGGGEMWGKWVFRAIEPPERLELVTSFADATGHTAREPNHPGWPLEMLTEVTFVAHAGVGRGTLVTVRSSALGASAAEQATFDAGHDSMRGGWTGTLVQLEAYAAGIVRGAAGAGG